ncbi:hypothetical protein MASR2M78_33620 [Treponema sp.]
MRKSLFILLIAPGLLLLSAFLFYPLVTVLAPTFMDKGFSVGRYLSFFTDSYYMNVLSGRSGSRPSQPWSA